MFLTSVPLITLSTVYWDYLLFHLHRSLTNHFSFHLLTSCSDKNLLINSLHFSCKIQTYMLGLRKPGNTLSLGSFHDFTPVSCLAPFTFDCPRLVVLICPLQFTIIVMFPYVSLGIHNPRRGRQMCDPHIAIFILWFSSLRDPGTEELCLSCVPVYIQCRFSPFSLN